MCVQGLTLVTRVKSICIYMDVYTCMCIDRMSAPSTYSLYYLCFMQFFFIRKCHCRSTMFLCLNHKLHSHQNDGCVNVYAYISISIYKMYVCINTYIKDWIYVLGVCIVSSYMFIVHALKMYMAMVNRLRIAATARPKHKFEKIYRYIYTLYLSYMHILGMNKKELNNLNFFCMYCFLCLLVHAFDFYKNGGKNVEK